VTLSRERCRGTLQSPNNSEEDSEKVYSSKEIVTDNDNDTESPICAYSLANVLSGSVAKQLRQDGKLRKHYEVMIFRILCATNYEHRFKLL